MLSKIYYLIKIILTILVFPYTYRKIILKTQTVKQIFKVDDQSRLNDIVIQHIHRSADTNIENIINWFIN